MSEKNRESNHSGISFGNLKNDINRFFCGWNEDESGLESVKNQILDMWNIASDIAEKNECIDTAALFPNKNVAKQIIRDMAFESYLDDNYEVAAYGFMRGSQLGDIGSRNNLVYMLRRGETKIIPVCNPREYLAILKTGLKEGEAFTIVNAALILSEMLGTERDWEVADKLISFLSDDCYSVINWWESLGKKGDSEGYLVHLWLIRHNKMERSMLGEIDEIKEQVSLLFPNAPMWLYEIKKEFNVDDFIAKIDQKIAELEAEERKEKEAQITNEEVPKETGE